MAKLTLELPFPPSVNHYWKRFGARTIIGKKGVQYRWDVLALVSAMRLSRPLDGPLSVEVCAYPPDKIKRDIDNMLKAPLDAMQKAGVYRDDNQISRLLIERRKVRRPGVLIVTITELGEQTVKARGES